MMCRRPGFRADTGVEKPIDGPAAGWRGMEWGGLGHGKVHQPVDQRRLKLKSGVVTLVGLLTIP
jgi:hypothetical protein